MTAPTVAEKPPAAIDSSIYNVTFYGILNADGDFWTPDAFHSEDEARDHIKRFWRNDEQTMVECLARFRIVPVRVQLTEMRAAHLEAAALAQGWTVQRGVKAGGKDRWISPCRTVFRGAPPEVAAHIAAQIKQGE